ncbi:MAG: hypothetical protein IPN79_18920 [Saprospiraceae bacterium]|nr:hypothetical protein [Saprospiraceae bacterium]
MEFDILNRSLETELTHENRSKPLILFLFFGLIGVFLIPIIGNSDSILAFVLIVTVIGIVVKFSSAGKSESEIINKNLIGKLYVNIDPFYLKDDIGNVLLDNTFKGKVILKYEGYNTEIEGWGRNPNIYFGTKNRILIKGSNFERSFFIYLEGTVGKNKFFKLSEILINSGIKVEEYTRGERTYLSKKLNYTEIQELKK